MVALEFAARPVLDQPGGAVRALHAVAAAAAQGQRRVATAVEEQHGLLAAGEGRPHGVDQRRRQEAATLGGGVAQVEQADLRQAGAAMAVGQIEPAIAPGLDIRDRLQARRGRDQHRRGVAQAGAHHRHVAGVVDHTFLLFEGGLVLLVNDDQAKVGEWQEQRRARAHHDRRRANIDRPPGGPPHPRRQIGMPHRRGHAEARGETVQPLRRQGDLGQQHQGLPPGTQAFRHRLQIHFGLARTGDAVQQGDREGPPCHRRAQGRSRRRLPGRQRGAGMLRVGPHERRTDRQRRRHQQPGLGHRPQHAGRHTGHASKIGAGPRLPVRQRRQHALSCLGQPGLGHRVGQPPARRRNLGAQRIDPQRHGQHLARHRQRVGGNPVDQPAQVGAHRRSVDAPGDRTQPVVAHR